jgi:error-prone DNA polymerase
MAMAVADFTGAEADELRRAMAFKRSDERMENTVRKLRERMSEKGISREVQDKVVNSIGSFAQYGFPESHAISFALIAYASCWLKVHFPAEFYAGLLNHQPMGFYSVNTLIQDARRHGVRVLPVSVLESGIETVVVDDGTLRLGLNRLKGVSGGTLGRIVKRRDAVCTACPETGQLRDFLLEIRASAKERRILARAGALNGLEDAGHRREAMWQVELPLFDDLLNADRGGGGVLPMMGRGERLAADFATQGASVGPHPMKLWREGNGSKRILRATDLHKLPHGVAVDVAGMAICRQRPGTAKGHCFISLEDETGIANLFVPKKTYQLLKQVITCEPFLHAEGRLQRTEGDQPTVYVTFIEPLSGISKEHAADSHDFH